MKIREELNKFDHQALDSDSQYYDFVNLYESIKPEITNDDQRELQKCIRERDFEKLNTYMSGIAARGNGSSIPSASVSEEVEVLEGNEYNQLDKIWEEELEEGRHDLKVEPTKAIESNKTHYRLRDTKTGELASYKTPYWYPTREGAQDAINDPDRDLGYGKDAKKTESLELDEVFSSYHGFYNPTPQIIAKIQEYKNKSSKVNISAVKDVEKLYTYYKTAYIVDWPQLRYDIISKTNLELDKEILDRIDNEFIKTSEKPEESRTEPAEEHSRGASRTGRKLTREELEALNEVKLTAQESDSDVESKVVINFNNGTIVDPEHFDNEMYAVMFKKPTKKNGDLFPAAMVLVKLYEECVVNGKSSISREDLVALAGIPNSDRPGVGSTWFNNFGELGLVVLNSNMVSPGPNLVDWIEGRAPHQYIDYNSGKPIGHFKRDGKWEEHPTSGNPNGEDLRKFVGKSFTTRNSQGLQPDRSHGKGDAKSTNKSNIVSPGVTNNSISIEEPTRNANRAGRKLARESIDLYKPEWSDLDRERSKQMRAIYRKEYNLDEEAEIVPPQKINYLDDRKFSGICLKHNWPINIAKKYLFGEED